MKIKNLDMYKKNVKSQFGEDGIIEHLFTKIPLSETSWSVEFGAWDGEYLSNTYNLVFNQKWNSVYIEGDKKKTENLRKKVKALQVEQDIEVINAFVESEGVNGLDSLLSNTKIPKEFELLSIDIDGIDYHVWKNFTEYSPKVVVVEHNPTIPPEIEYIPEDNYSIRGASVKALYKLGLVKGYELVACTDVNCIFVRKDLFPLFNIENNTPENLMKRDYITYMIANFDGTYTLSNEPAYINIYDDNLPEKMKKEKNILKRIYYFYQQATKNLYRDIIVFKSILK